MNYQNKFAGLVMVLVILFLANPAFSQDKVYLTGGTVQTGKVTEIGPSQLRMLKDVRPDGPLYVINTSEIDSVVYSNGMREELKGVKRKRDLLQNIPELNTWSFDLLGFSFLSISQSYERRIKDGKIGLRIPLYVGFEGGGIAGVGTFLPGSGVLSPGNNGGTGGFSIATGLNPKFYLFKRRVVRAFIGPEATIGYSVNYIEIYNYYNYNYQNTGANRCGTVAALAKFGLSINPLDKFNITVDGGAGVGDMFGGINPLGLVGLWHIGLALGTNF